MLQWQLLPHRYILAGGSLEGQWFWEGFPSLVAEGACLLLDIIGMGYRVRAGDRDSGQSESVIAIVMW